MKADSTEGPLFYVLLPVLIFLCFVGFHHLCLRAIKAAQEQSVPAEEQRLQK
jgi:hypothetical protein